MATISRNGIIKRISLDPSCSSCTRHRVSRGAERDGGGGREKIIRSQISDRCTSRDEDTEDRYSSNQNFCAHLTRKIKFAITMIETILDNPCARERRQAAQFVDCSSCFLSFFLSILLFLRNARRQRVALREFRFVVDESARRPRI